LSRCTCSGAVAVVFVWIVEDEFFDNGARATKRGRGGGGGSGRVEKSGPDDENTRIKIVVVLVWRVDIVGQAVVVVGADDDWSGPLLVLAQLVGRCLSLPYILIIIIIVVIVVENQHLDLRPTDGGSGVVVIRESSRRIFGLDNCGNDELAFLRLVIVDYLSSGGSNGRSHGHGLERRWWGDSVTRSRSVIVEVHPSSPWQSLHRRGRIAFRIAMLILARVCPVRERV
jgi:hypothetical protein